MRTSAWLELVTKCILFGAHYNYSLLDSPSFFLSALSKVAQPHLQTFWGHARVELGPPSPAQWPAIKQGFSKCVVLGQYNFFSSHSVVHVKDSNMGNNVCVVKWNELQLVKTLIVLSFTGYYAPYI